MTIAVGFSGGGLGRINRMVPYEGATSDINLGTFGFGDSANKTLFDTTGHQTMIGNARPWRDQLGDVTTLKVVGVGIEGNDAEGTRDFLTSANLSDYLQTNLQLNHDKDLTCDIFPHLHWFQTENKTPNWLLQYRWQINLSAKTTAWTSLKCVTNAVPYNVTITNQISISAPIAVPPGSIVSDIVQFRIISDNAGADAQFGGVADTYTGKAMLLSFDCHFQINSLGSTDEYEK